MLPGGVKDYKNRRGIVSISRRELLAILELGEGDCR
uniref:Uncharacterized protein n=1 Tax=Rhizophora mucronata TaxID=61149 RepID=A0A2P2NQA5_RHIMU